MCGGSDKICRGESGRAVKEMMCGIRWHEELYNAPVILNE